MNNYLVTAEDINGKVKLQRIEADSVDEAKYLFYKTVLPRSKWIRILSVGLTTQEFCAQEE